MVRGCTLAYQLRLGEMVQLVKSRKHENLGSESQHPYISPALSAYICYSRMERDKRVYSPACVRVCVCVK